MQSVLQRNGARPALMPLIIKINGKIIRFIRITIVIINVISVIIVSIIRQRRGRNEIGENKKRGKNCSAFIKAARP